MELPLSQIEYPDVAEIYFSRRLLEHLSEWHFYASLQQRNQEICSQAYTFRNEMIKREVFNALVCFLQQQSVDINIAVAGFRSLTPSANPQKCDPIHVGSNSPNFEAEEGQQQSLDACADALRSMSVEISMEIVRALLEGWRMFAAVDVLTPSSMPIMKFENHSHKERKVVELVQDVAKRFLAQWEKRRYSTIASARKQVAFRTFRKKYGKALRGLKMAGDRRHPDGGTESCATRAAFDSWFTYVSHILPIHEAARMLHNTVERVRLSHTLAFWKVLVTKNQIYVSAYNFFSAWASKQCMNAHFLFWKIALLVSCADEMYFHLFAFRFFYPWFDYKSKKLSLYKSELRFPKKLHAFLTHRHFGANQRVFYKLKCFQAASQFFHGRVQHGTLTTFFQFWQLYLADVYYFHNQGTLLRLHALKYQLTRFVTAWYEIAGYCLRLDSLRQQFFRRTCRNILQSIMLQWQVWSRKGKLLKYVSLEVSTDVSLKLKLFVFHTISKYARANAFWCTVHAAKVIFWWHHSASKKHDLRRRIHETLRRNACLVQHSVLDCWRVHTENKSRCDELRDKIHRTHLLNLKLKIFRSFQHCCTRQNLTRLQKDKSWQAYIFGHLRQMYFLWLKHVLLRENSRRAEIFLEKSRRKFLLNEHLLVWKYAVVYRSFETRICRKIAFNSTRHWREWATFSKFKDVNFGRKSLLRKICYCWSAQIRDQADKRSRTLTAEKWNKSSVKARFFDLFTMYVQITRTSLKVSELGSRKRAHRWFRHWNLYLRRQREMDILHNALTRRLCYYALRRAFTNIKSVYARGEAVRAVIHQIDVVNSKYVARKCFQAMRSLVKVHTRHASQNAAQALEVWRGLFLRKVLVKLRKFGRQVVIEQGLQVRNDEYAAHSFCAWASLSKEQRQGHALIAVACSLHNATAKKVTFEKWSRHSQAKLSAKSWLSSKTEQRRRSCVRGGFECWNRMRTHWNSYERIQYLQRKKLLRMVAGQWHLLASCASKIQESVNNHITKYSILSKFKAFQVWRIIRLKNLKVTECFRRCLSKHVFISWHSVSMTKKLYYNKCVLLKTAHGQSRKLQTFSTWSRNVRIRKLTRNCASLTCYRARTGGAFRDWLRRTLKCQMQSQECKKAQRAFALHAKRRFFAMLLLFVRRSRVKCAVIHNHGRRVQSRVIRLWTALTCEIQNLQNLEEALTLSTHSSTLRRAFNNMKCCAVLGEAVRTITHQIDIVNSRHVVRKCFQAMRRLVKAYFRHTSHNAAQVLEAWRGAFLRKLLCAVRKKSHYLMLIDHFHHLNESLPIEYFSIWILACSTQITKRKMFRLLSVNRDQKSVKSAFALWCDSNAWSTSSDYRATLICEKCAKNTSFLHFDQWRIWVTHFAKAADLRELKERNTVFVTVQEWRRVGWCRARATEFHAHHQRPKFTKAVLHWQRYSVFHRWRKDLSENARALGCQRLFAKIWRLWSKLRNIEDVESRIEGRIFNAAWLKWLCRYQRASRMRKNFKLLHMPRVKRVKEDTIIVWQQSVKKALLSATIIGFISRKRNESSLSRIVFQWQLTARFEQKLHEACDALTARFISKYIRSYLISWCSCANGSRSMRKYLHTRQANRNLLTTHVVFHAFKMCAKSSRSYRIKAQLVSYLLWKHLAGMHIFWKSLADNLMGFYIGWICSQVLRGWHEFQKSRREQRICVHQARNCARRAQIWFDFWTEKARTSVELKEKGASIVVSRNAKIAAFVLYQWRNMLSKNRCLQKHRVIALLEPLGNNSIMCEVKRSCNGPSRFSSPQDRVAILKASS